MKERFPFQIGGADGKIVLAARIVRLFQKHQFFERGEAENEKSPELSLPHFSVEVVHMQADERFYLCRLFLGGAESGEDFSRDAFPFFGV